MVFSPALKQSTIAFFEFLQATGIPHKPIEEGEDTGVWFPLAKTLRACGFEQPKDCDPVLDLATIRKMLVGGKVQACIDIEEFTRLFAGFCTHPVATEMALHFANDVMLPQYHQLEGQGDELLANLERREEMLEGIAKVDDDLSRSLKLGHVRGAIVGGKMRLVAKVPPPDAPYEEHLGHFLTLYPEWSGENVKGEFISPQCALQFHDWMTRSYPYHNHENAELMRAKLTEIIIEDFAGDFSPRGFVKYKTR